ncbi:MAG: hypothetical protein M1829_000130 [Trizodia sp. TS-e1964]|nr:MAG: hypothetical protein M1829_000130 [Trizodia sp. TS-e1964]
MGRPRLIILIRHAQSEGNKNRDIHQTVPDHRVKLTPEGQRQAYEAGLKLRSMLLPTDTLHFFTSPYRRTRETTQGILSSLTSADPTPSPFPRSSIKVYEEPRLREQDFGNFQPCSAEMERMWQERADYGHFFYRIPNGESAADAYDRVSGFNESLWRQFGEADFASVCVLVTHGLMTRVFLMKWYHYSVEYFEDLRNVNHCEFVLMERPAGDGPYVLKTELRTWTQLANERALTTSSAPPEPLIQIRNTWGGCPNGCSHADFTLASRRRHEGGPAEAVAPEKAAPRRNPSDSDEDEDDPRGRVGAPAAHLARLTLLQAGRDFGGTNSGAASVSGEEEEGAVPEAARRARMENRRTWSLESGMGAGARANALGDWGGEEGEGEGVGEGGVQLSLDDLALGDLRRREESVVESVR